MYPYIAKLLNAYMPHAFDHFLIYVRVITCDIDIKCILCLTWVTFSYQKHSSQNAEN